MGGDEVCFRQVECGSGDKCCIQNTTAPQSGSPCSSCCALLDTEGSGAFFSFFVQTSLLVLGFVSLLVKRKYEKPQRERTVWLFDVSKQAASGMCAHGMGMINSAIMNGITKNGSGDECSWYFLGFSLDTTVGVVFAYFGLKFTSTIARKYGVRALVDVGNYGTPPERSIYLKQMASWCIITVVARLFVLLVEVALQDPLSWMSRGIASPLAHDPKVMLVIVMIGCPLCMNIIQLWIQDTFLKEKPEFTKMDVGDVSSGRLRQSLGGSIQERASMDGSLKTSSTYSQIGSGHRPGTY